MQFPDTVTRHTTCNKESEKPLTTGRKYYPCTKSLKKEGTFKEDFSEDHERKFKKQQSR